MFYILHVPRKAIIRSYKDDLKHCSYWGADATSIKRKTCIRVFQIQTNVHSEHAMSLLRLMFQNNPLCTSWNRIFHLLSYHKHIRHPILDFVHSHHAMRTQVWCFRTVPSHIMKQKIWSSWFWQRHSTWFGLELVRLAHGILLGPCPSRLLVARTLCLVHVSNLRDERIIRIGVCEKGADGEEDLRYCQRWAPLLLEDVKADASVRVDVWVINLHQLTSINDKGPFCMSKLILFKSSLILQISLAIDPDSRSKTWQDTMSM